MKHDALPDLRRDCFRSKAVSFVLAALGLLGTTLRSHAQTSIWLSDVAIDSQWSNPLNWTALLVPQTGYNVTINNGIIFPTAVNQNVNATISSLALGSGASLTTNATTLVIGANSTVGGTLRVVNNGTITLQSATINNTGGTIEAQSGSAVIISNSTISSGNVTVSGTGTSQFADATLSNVTLTNSAAGVIHAVSGTNTFLGTYIDAVGSQVRVDNGAKLSLQGPPASATLNGGIYVDSTGSSTVLEIGVAGLTFVGPGKIVLSDNASNRITGLGANAAVTLSSNFTVQGAGQLGAGSLGFTNQGLILADQSNSLVVKPSSLGFSNAGTLRSTNGATLGLSNGTFTNSGSGAMIAENNSFIDVTASTIVGGSLTSIGSGHFHALSSSTLSGVTITSGSNVEVGNGETLTLLGNIVNNGTVSLLSSGSSTDLKIDSSVTITGNGTIALTDSPNNRVYAASGGSALVIGANQTLSGAGEVGRDNLALTNQGTILANGANALVINNSGATFTNAGALKATGIGGLTLSDASVTNQGSFEIATNSNITAAGTVTQNSSSGGIKLTGGTLAASSLALQAGSLGGSGTITGIVTATGDATIIPGGVGGLGTLTFNNTLTLGPTNSIYFDLGGTTPGTGYDRINGTNVAANGSLFLTFTNGFQYSIGASDTFTLINASTALTGTFSGVANGSRLTTTDGLGSFQVNYLANALTLSNFQAVPEPSTWALLGFGSLAVALAEYRRRRRS